MPTLVITKNYADNTVLTQLQLNQAFDSVTDLINNVKLDDENIQAGSISQGLLAANSVGTPQLISSSITLQKLASEVAERLVPAGAVIPYAGDVIPNGYLYCDGAAVSRTAFSSLFTAIGTKHGQGDSSSTFNIPDYRGRFLRGFDNGTARDPDAAARTAMNTGGVTGDAVGSIQGHEFASHLHGGGDHAHTMGGASTLTNGVYPGPFLIGAGGTQASANLDHTHVINNSGAIISAEGGNETRPINANVRFLIKY